MLGTIENLFTIPRTYLSGWIHLKRKHVVNPISLSCATSVYGAVHLNPLPDLSQ